MSVSNILKWHTHILKYHVYKNTSKSNTFQHSQFTGTEHLHLLGKKPTKFNKQAQEKQTIVTWCNTINSVLQKYVTLDKNIHVYQTIYYKRFNHPVMSSHETLGNSSIALSDLIFKIDQEAKHSSSSEVFANFDLYQDVTFVQIKLQLRCH